MTIYLNAKTSIEHYLAAGILTLSCLTDMLDGYIARRYNMISRVGKILDPIADKATQLTLLLCIASKNPIVQYFLALFVTKELFQLIAALLMLKKGKMLDGALKAGKISTAFLFFSLILIVTLRNLPTSAIIVLMINNALLTTNAMLAYMHTYMRQDNRFISVKKDIKS
jgi:cardiolipin synthase